MKKNNYNNVLTYTYGRKGNEEAQISEKVAEFLGYDWIFVEYKNKNMRKKYYNKQLYNKVAKYTGNIYSVPLIQEWEAVCYMRNNGVLNGNEIVVPGYSGDFIAGSHIPQKIYENENSNLDDLKTEILCKHYNLCKLYQKEYNGIFWKKIQEEYNVTNDKYYQKEELIEIIEMFDFQERQAKFISNAVRIYEFYNLDWYMPLWDKELLEYWKKIDYKHRYKRQLYIDFTEYIYPELMEYAPIAKSKKVKNKSFINKLYMIYNCYFNHFLNYYGYLKFSEYIFYCLKYGTLNYYFMFSLYYIRKLKVEEKTKNLNR